MLSVLKTVRGLLKLQGVWTDNIIFQLHYKLTVSTLLIVSLFITSRDYFSTPTDCHFPEYSHGSLNSYCAVQSTYRLIPNMTGAVERDIGHDRVSECKEKSERVYYNYYQWVFVILFIQALLFYIPRHMWNTFERRKIEALSNGLKLPALSRESLSTHVNAILHYFCLRLHLHNNYAMQYFGCELLNLINVLSQICLMDFIFGGGFGFHATYIKYLSQSAHEDIPNPIEWMFPTMTKCTYHQYGISGGIEKFDGMCTLTQNSANQGIFVILWFWLHFLAIADVLVVIYRSLLVCVSSIRFKIFQSTTGMNSTEEIKLAYNQLWYGDWFLLHLLQKNIDPLAYKELITCIVEYHVRKTVRIQTGIWYV